MIKPERKNKFHKPPSLCKKILLTMLSVNDREGLCGDFEEIYNDYAAEKGRVRARLWYLRQLLAYFPRFFSNSIYWRTIMIQNYLKISFRTIQRHKVYSCINIFGLAIGMACFILIFLWVQDELSYDRFHEKADQIYRVAVRARIGDTEINQATTPPALAGTLLQDYSEVLHSVRLYDKNMVLIRHGEQSFSEHNKVAYADPSLFDVFTFRFIKGDPKTALTQPNTVVITENAAHKYFGARNPVNQLLTIDNNDYQVTAVIENVPESSHFHFDLFISSTTFAWSKSTSWWNNDFKTYIVLQKDYPKEEFEAKLYEIVKKHIYKSGEETWTKIGNYWRYYLQSITKIHLHSHLDGEFEANGSASYISIFSIIAFFILFMSCTNYINLSTAKSSNRAVEVGVRKVLGSKRSQLIRQFLSESIVSSLTALLLATGIVAILLPSFRTLVGKNLSIDLFDNPFVLPCLIGLALITGIMSGAYPSFLLSSFLPASVLKRKTLGQSRNSWFRNGLVLIQFSISVFLIIGTLNVHRQLKYTQNKNLGFDREHVVVIKNHQHTTEKSDLFKESLKNHASIISASNSSSLPGREVDNYGFIPEGEDAITMNLFCCDDDFLDTLGLEMKIGRFFSKDFKTDSSAIVINEETVRLLGWKDPLNRYIYSNNQNLNVIGVVKDFHYQSLHQPVRPMAFLLLKGVYDFLTADYISVRVKPENIKANLYFIEKKWGEYFPGIPLDYSFLDEDYSKLYKNEQLTEKTFSIFSLLAILIAGLGLFGLSSFVAEARTKEIGIRKVFGASIPKIVLMLSKEFTKWVVFSNIVSWPIAYYVMNSWLQNFAYRIDIGLWSFIFAAILSFTIALVTVCYQSYKAAIANPVDSLRYE